MIQAVAYLRTSSATNRDGDSPFRQNDAITAYAARQGMAVDSCWWDLDVPGRDLLEKRDGFMDMMAHMKAQGITHILVETNGRFARDYTTQGRGLMLLASQSITVFDASNGLEMTDLDDPMNKAVVAILGVMSGLEKDMVVAKLKRARERKRALTGKCEGRKSHVEKNEGLLRETKRLARKNPATGKTRSLREIAAELAALGYTTKSGKPYSHTTVRDMLA